MELKLPAGVISHGDLNRLIRELNKLNDYLVGAQYKNEEAETVKRSISPLLTELANANECSLLDDNSRQQLYQRLQELSAGAPSLHISFTAAPSPRFMEQLISWMRANIHPQVLVTVGLQPTIAAGCVLRTPNRVIDMGLKQTLLKQQPVLMEMIKGIQT